MHLHKVDFVILSLNNFPVNSLLIIITTAKMESLTQIVTLKPGMRVLDIGCGKAISSIFLAKEFGVQVWAVDLMQDVNENYKRIKEMNLENQVKHRI